MLREFFDPVEATKGRLLWAQVVDVDVDLLHLLTPACRVVVVLQLDGAHSRRN